MKLNKKLLMAALAGAIVVGGGVSSFADEYLGEVGNPEEVEKSYDETVADYWTKKIAEDEKAAKEAAEKAENNKNGYSTKEKAEAAAEEALKTDKVNNKFKIDVNHKGRFIYSLYIGNSDKQDEKTEEKTEEKSNQFTEHEFVFRTKEQAEYAANYALEHEFLNPGHINNSYKVSQKYDGNWEYVLSPNLPETPKKPEEKKPEDKRPKMTIDQWLLKNAKEDAIAELKKAGITSDFYFNAINKAKTVEGVNALKNEILKAHAGKEVNPSTPEVTPSVPENHYFENDYANIGAGKGTKEDGKKEESKENGKKEDSKEESKENGKKEDSKQESKENGKKEQKPGKEEKPAKEGKENTDSPNKKKKEKAALPKAGSEAEILTLAAASLSSVAGAFISLKKRK